MVKTRVGVILRDSVGKNKSNNRSVDLENLQKNQWPAFIKKLQALIQALQQHHGNLKKLEQSRQLVAKGFGALTKGTPLFESVGLMPSADRPSSSVCSYTSVHDELAAKSQAYSSKYAQFVLEYAVEWEKIVRERVENGIKVSNEARVELDHYQKKVEALRLQVNQAMAKGKPVSASVKEKLHRNEEKYLANKQRYNVVATDLCILIEEVTERQWRDLHPLLIKCAQFDMTLAADEAKVLANLNVVIGNLKQVATEQGISPQPRLKDLASLKPELLSTRPGGVAGLAIEAGGAFLNMEESALPPGSVGPQGLGGFPIQIASPSNGGGVFGTGGIARTGSQGSMHSAPGGTSVNMGGGSNGGIFSASAPTFDDVYAALPTTTMINIGHRSDAFGTLQPSPHNNNNNSPWSVRSSSFNDADSAYSGYSNLSATAMGLAPPPPPNVPPPPPPPTPGYPPPSSMYSSSSGLPPQPPPSSSYNAFSPQNQFAPLHHNQFASPPAPLNQFAPPTTGYNNHPNPMALYPPPQPQSKPNHNPFG